MATVAVKTPAGAEQGTVELADEVFGIQPNVPVMHQVVTAQLAHRRAGTQSTKTRAEVRGGGRKPYRQKGTGNARQGSTRAPHWSRRRRGPRPQAPVATSQRTPKKMIRLALRSALSDRAADGKVVVIDEWGWTAPSTKAGKAALGALGLEGKVLVVVQADDDNVILSFRNLPEVQLRRGRRAERLRRAVQRLDRVQHGHAAGAVGRGGHGASPSPRRLTPSRRAGGGQ